MSYFSPTFISATATPATPCLYTRSQETLKHTDTQQSESEKQLALSSFQPKISEPDMTRLSFSSAEPVCYLVAGVPSDFYRVHFLCLLRQHTCISHLWRRWYNQKKSSACRNPVLSSQIFGNNNKIAQPVEKGIILDLKKLRKLSCP